MARKPWTAARIQRATLRELSVALERGAVTEEGLLNYYNKKRETLMRYARTIAKDPVHGYAAFGQQRPKYQTRRELELLAGRGNILRAVVDISQAAQAETRTLAGRKRQQKKAVETLQKRGVPGITEQNYGAWVQFHSWLSSSKWAHSYYINSEEAENAFINATDPGSGRVSFGRIVELFEQYVTEGI